VASVVLATAGAVLVWFIPPFNRPASDAGIGAFADYYADNREVILATIPLAVTGVTLTLGVFVVWRERLKTSNSTWASLGLAASIVTVAMTVIGLAALMVPAYRAGADARLATDLGFSAINLAAGPTTALSILAFTAAFAAGPYRRTWLTVAGVVIAGAHLVVAASWDERGFFSPEGTISNLVPALWFVWIGLGSAVLIRSAD
jgi:hypothetical protein